MKRKNLFHLSLISMVIRRPSRIAPLERVICVLNWRTNMAVAASSDAPAGRSFDARRLPGYPPYPNLSFKVGSAHAGDVDAQIWVRFDEIKASLGLIEQILDKMPEGSLRIESLPASSETFEGAALVEGFRGDIFVWVRIGAAGVVQRCHLRDPSWFINGRCSKRRSRAISSLIFRSATNRSTVPIRGTTSKGSASMRKFLFQGLHRPPVTEAAPLPDDPMIAELASAPQSSEPPQTWPQSVHPRGRRGLMQWLRTRNSRARQCFL